MTVHHLLLLLVLTSGCGLVHSPIAVSGTPSDLEALAGVWSGTYESRDTGRMGSVFFALAAADSASGEVVMAPQGRAVDVSQNPDGTWRWTGTPRARVLTIQSVRLTDGQVVGVLDPYQDPDCGCWLRTTFTGDLEDGALGEDVIEGTFVITAERETYDAGGTWRVVRRR